MIVVNVKDVGKYYCIFRFELFRFANWLGFKFKPTDKKWVLHDINFTLQQGETLGILGKNGAGKSSLLKIISGVQQSSTGSVNVTGKIVSILELGIGSNPELTGRQNVIHFLSLMGFSSKKVQEVMPRVESFCDIGGLFDEFFRVYSSGMQVRLAFATVTVCRPDLLIVDEALSVGDIQFQQKCVARIKEYVEQGMALILTTHDLAMFHQVCQKGILLHEGQCLASGDTKRIAEKYLTLLNMDGDVPQTKMQTLEAQKDTLKKGVLSHCLSKYIVSVSLLNHERQPINSISEEDSFYIQVALKNLENFKDPHLRIRIQDRFGAVMYETNTYRQGYSLISKDNRKLLSVEICCMNHLLEGQYTLSIGIDNEGYAHDLFKSVILPITVISIFNIHRDNAEKPWSGTTNLNVSFNLSHLKHRVTPSTEKKVSSSKENLKLSHVMRKSILDPYKDALDRLKIINEKNCDDDTINDFFDQFSGVYYDVTDLILHAQNSIEPTGIQRVVLELCVSRLMHKNFKFFFLNPLDYQVYCIEGLEKSSLKNLSLFKGLFGHALLSSHKLSLATLLGGKIFEGISPPMRDLFNRKMQYWGIPTLFRRMVLMGLSIKPLYVLCIWFFSWYTSRRYVVSDSLKITQGIPMREKALIVMVGAMWNMTKYYEHFHDTYKHCAKFAYFFHDIIPLMTPHYVSHRATQVFEPYLKYILDTADILITSSVNNKLDVVYYNELKSYRLPVPEIECIGLPYGFKVSPEPFFEEDLRDTVKNLGSKSYMLYVSTIDSRKNHIGLLESWKIFLESDEYENQILVIAGVWGRGVENVRAQLQNTQYYNGTIVLIEKPTDTELQYLYEKCLFTIYASHYEGWGLPISESLYFNKPVIHFDNSCLSEVSLGVGCVVENGNLSKLAEEIKKLFCDSKFREENIAILRSINHQLPRWTDYSNKFFSTIKNALSDSESR